MGSAQTKPIWDELFATKVTTAATVTMLVLIVASIVMVILALLRVYPKT